MNINRCCCSKDGLMDCVAESISELHFYLFVLKAIYEIFMLLDAGDYCNFANPNWFTRLSYHSIIFELEMKEMIMFLELSER